VPFTNPEPEQIKALLKSVKTIAVLGFSPKPVRASTRGGDLTIRCEGGDNPVWMTGPAVTVLEGEAEIDEC
jgi:diaminopimelate epimerase